MKLKIAIIGTRGIPNQYGGFEQFAEYLSAGLVKKNHSVYVYSPHNHPYQQKNFNGVNLVHCYDPEQKLGTAGQFIYDLNCILDARKRNFDLLLFLGYTSSAVWGRLYPKGKTIISNMDGLEWKRSKYAAPVQKFILYSEKLAVTYSHFLIADSIGIQKYLKTKYHVPSQYIAYGASVFKNFDEEILSSYGLQPWLYNLLIARMEPENNIEMILDGFESSCVEQIFLVIGNTTNKYGTYIKQKFEKNVRIRFLGAIYNQEHINNLRYYSNLYFHGHSVGGTNPSLLEAMACSALIAAHDNLFNKAILAENGFYFSSPDDVRTLLNEKHKINHEKLIKNNLIKIEIDFNWDKIITEYENYFLKCFSKNNT